MDSDVFAMWSPTFAIVLRCVGATATLALVLTGTIRFGAHLLLFYTYWSMLAAFLAFTLIIIRKAWSRLPHLVAESLPVVWNLAATATVGFWCFVAPFLDDMSIQSIFNHSVALIFLSVELWFDQVSVGWRHMWISVGVGVIFMFAVNLPYTLLYEPMYSIVTYTDWISYIAILGILSLCALESAGLLWVKKKILQKRGNYDKV